MLFEVYRNGQRLMYTTNARYIPDDEQIRQMRAAGCRILMDGQAYKGGGGIAKTKPKKSAKDTGRR